MNPFERLGLPEKLSLSREDLEKTIQKESAKNHPDAGGDAVSFEEVRRAGEILQNPGSRLRAAVELVDGELSPRGQVPGAVMDCFSAVAGLLERVSAFVKERRGARSGLGRAVLDSQVPGLKRELEEMTSRLAGLEDQLGSRFPEFDERGWSSCVAEMAEVSRSLVFLRKWQAEIREAQGKVFEALLGG